MSLLELNYSQTNFRRKLIANFHSWLKINFAGSYNPTKQSHVNLIIGEVISECNNYAVLYNW